MDKQIFAALEVANHEIRLIVGEFFNTRFNIIKVERVICSSFMDNNVNKDELIKCIKKAVDNASKTIGAKITKVILAIPTVDFKRIPLKVRVDVEGVVSISDVKEAIKKATSTNIDKNLALIQAHCIKYTVNGIGYRRIPINERCNELIVNIDLLCANKNIAFDLVNCVTKSNLEVMDIFLDVYAASKEAALFEQSVDQNIILLDVEQQFTTLGLITQGKISACDRIDVGLSDFISGLINSYNPSIPIADAIKLVKYNARLNIDNVSNNSVYVLPKKDKDRPTSTINEQELCEKVRPSVEKWLELVETMCKPILQVGETTVIIIGEGGEMQGLDYLLSKKLDVEVRSYSPETLGVRKSSLTNCLGLFYAYKDQLEITQSRAVSVDMEQFNKTVSYKNSSKSDSDESITKKLKGILFEARK